MADRREPGGETGPVSELGEVDANGPGEVEGHVSTTLVEVSEGIAVLFGEVPAGIDLVDLDLIPSFDRAELSAALGALGNVGTIAGNVAATAQGLYRVNDATMALLKSGGELAVKDGARLGAIFKDGQLVAQARFVPASMTTATALSAIGPAVAMLGLQMQLGEISGLVRDNIDLTTQTLKAIRREQWSELEGLSESIGSALQEARQLDAVTDTVWDPVSAGGPLIRKHMTLYRKHVAGHLAELDRRSGGERRRYLENNAEAMVFDTHAMSSALKTYAEYEVLRAARARLRSAADENEERLFDLIIRETPPEIAAALEEIAELTGALVRELRIIAELPGRAGLPLTKKRRDAKTVKLTCQTLLEAMEPLADSMQSPAEMPAVPDTVCAPSELDLEPYLRLLRWLLEDGESVHGIAFPYSGGVRDLAGTVPALLARRVDAAWDGLRPGRSRVLAERLAASTFVAVTDRRIVTADPRKLLGEGELAAVYPLADVRFVRSRHSNRDHVRPTVGVATERSDVSWIFPADADRGVIDALTTAIDRGAEACTEARALVGAPEHGIG